MRLLTWHVEALRVGASQKETYRLDGDYNPVRAWVHFQGAPAGTETIIDIHVDGKTIFVYRPRSMGDKDVEETVFASVQFSKDSYVTLDIDQIGKEPGREMTVGLELEEV